MRLDVYVHLVDETESFLMLGKLDEIIWQLRQIRREEAKMAGELDALTVQVTRNTDVEASAVQALNGIRAALDAAIASGDPTRLTALSASLATSADGLAAAIVANTPPTP